MELQETVAALARGFSTSTRMLTAIGDETRQHIMLEMMQIGRCSGVRVGRSQNGPTSPARLFPTI